MPLSFLTALLLPYAKAVQWIWQSSGTCSQIRPPLHMSSELMRRSDIRSGKCRGGSGNMLPALKDSCLNGTGNMRRANRITATCPIFSGCIPAMMPLQHRPHQATDIRTALPWLRGNLLRCAAMAGQAGAWHGRHVCGQG